MHHSRLDSLWLKQLVAGARLACDGDGNARALLQPLRQGHCHPVSRRRNIHHARRWSCNQHLVACRSVGLDGELCHTEFGEVFHTLADIDLALSGIGTLVLVPLAHEPTLIVAIPEATVEDGGESLVPTDPFFSSVKVPSSTAWIASL